MRFFITGGTGFVGRHLISHLLDCGHEVMALARNPAKFTLNHVGLQKISGDPMREGPWQKQVGHADVLINLVGRSIFGRWNEEIKKEIIESRLISTRNLVASIPQEKARTMKLVNANAVGYYAGGDEIRTESSTKGHDFLSEVCEAWQNEAFKAEAKGTRVVIARFGVVLGSNGGALQKMLPVFKKGLGGKIGNGSRWFSWIHVLDLCRILEFAAVQDQLNGVINVCAEPVTNAQFTQSLARAVGRPTFFRVPEFALKLALGEAADVILAGQRVISRVLPRHGFQFRFPEINEALQHLVQEHESPDRSARELSCACGSR
ncbi:MAG: TIGR01777 family oxidoreductase [Dissulfuribacterales bacterium]